MPNRLATLLLAGAFLLGFCLPARAGDTDDRMRALEARINALESELRALKSETGEPAPVAVTASGKNTAKLSIGGYLQGQVEIGDVSASFGSFTGGPNEIDDRFRLRRGRLTMKGEVLEDFDFALSAEFMTGDGASSGRTTLAARDLFINWHRFPAANVKVGQFKAPFGLEQLTLVPKLLLAERSLMTEALTPDRQIGAQLWGKPLAFLAPDHQDFVSYAVGIFNGNNRNTAINDNSNFMYAGRLEFQPFAGKVGGHDLVTRLGGNALWSRDEAGTNISQNAGLLVNDDGSLTRFTLPGDADRTAWGVDGSVTLGPFDLRAEYIQEKVRPRGPSVAGFGEFTADGYYVQGAWFALPKRLQLITRWESLDPGQAPDDDIHSITGGATCFIHSDQVRLMLNYIHTWSDFRAAHSDLGPDQFDEVILRLQLIF